jgi:hypothetical protein
VWTSKLLIIFVILNGVEEILLIFSDELVRDEIEAVKFRFINDELIELLGLDKVEELVMGILIFEALVVVEFVLKSVEEASRFFKTTALERFADTMFHDLKLLIR